MTLEAVAAVDGLVTPRLERHFCRAAAAAAGRAEHLPLTAAAAAVKARSAAAAALLRFTRSPAIRATARLVLETLLGIELLLAGGEGELLSTIHACDKLIGIHLVETPIAHRLRNSALHSDSFRMSDVLNGRPWGFRCSASMGRERPSLYQNLCDIIIIRQARQARPEAWSWNPVVTPVKTGRRRHHPTRRFSAQVLARDRISRKDGAPRW